ncbi:MAG: signal peptidase II [bacterium]|nr:signal peptidase II [bacterium]
MSKNHRPQKEAEATGPSAAGADSDSRTGQRRKSRYLLLSLAVLVLDQWTKWLVEFHLLDHASVPVIPQLLNFTHVRNTGVAFGLFASHGATTGTLILTILGLGALAFVGYYFRIVPARDRTLLIALALVLGGAVGNLLDRIISGGVTDFVDFYIGTYHWHTFNVADTAISIGIGLMILGAFRQGKPEKVAPSAATS